MSLKTSQIIIISLAGLSTAIGVAWATIQSGSMKLSNPPQTESAVSDEKAISAIPKPNPQSQKFQPQPAKNSPVESSQKVEPVLIAPPDSGCKISMAIINDSDPPLNVRSHPRLTDSKIVGKLNNNTFVSVTQEQNGWLRITDPVPGWIAKNRTESSCPNVRQEINFLPGGDEAIVKGRIIGGGSHSYIIRAAKSQTMTVKNRKDVFPQILTPDGKLLTGNPYKDNQTEWTGKILVTGNYTFQLDSNFRGYEYEFSVKVR
ncbi:MAG: SH3 domain-containing protein [Oscillatoriales cyanobacterium]|nr:MAG: SH3 domain-containing protein [Oscillatoriales cyanobacterium]TAH20693.1 MAG: SH3 domain-containing protein [Oscillatoriales cyanobacterium]